MSADRPADSGGSLSPPSGRDALREIRVLGDAVRMLGALALSPRRPRNGVCELLVILAPGFGSDGRYLAPMRRYLAGYGFTAEDWGLGRNLAGIDLPHTLDDVSDRWSFTPRREYRGEASVPLLCDRLIERVQRRHDHTGLPVALVGWSLGGYLCREAARDLPGVVERVVTFGSPTQGGPKYTAAATVFRKRGMDLDWIEEEVARRESKPIRQPITAIYSRSDGIVDWRACIDHHSPAVRHVEVDAAHLGMGLNPAVWKIVRSALATPSD
ncbi:MAG: alpha/beta fold hydrolase [Lysobacterales bacterium]